MGVVESGELQQLKRAVERNLQECVAQVDLCLQILWSATVEAVAELKTRLRNKGGRRQGQGDGKSFCEPV